MASGSALKTSWARRKGGAFGGSSSLFVKDSEGTFASTFEQFYFSGWKNLSPTLLTNTQTFYPPSVTRPNNDGFVGKTSMAIPGAASGNTSVSLTNLLGGNRNAPAQGDIIVVSYAISNGGSPTLLIQDASAVAYTQIGTQQSNTDPTATTNVIMRVAYKIVGASPDTEVQVGPTGDASRAGVVNIQVFSNVDSVTPIDVTSTTATGTSSQPDPAAITPTTANAKIVAFGAMIGNQTTGGQITGAFTSSNLNQFESCLSDDTSDIISGAGYSIWTSGAFNPAGYTGATAGDQAWVAKTIALRPSSGVSLAIDSASYTLTNTDISLLKGSTLSLTSLDYSLSNTAIGLLFGRLFPLDNAAYSLTNTAINFNKGYALTFDIGTFNLTNTDQTFLRGYVFPITSGSYSLSNTAINFLLGRLLGIDSGSFSLTNTAINFNKGYALTFDNAAFNLTNTNIAFPRGYVFPVTSGSYSLTNTDQTFLRGYVVSLAPTSYSLTNTDLSLLKGFVLPVSSGSFNVSGTNVSFNRGYIVVLDTTAYLVTGTGLVFSIADAPIVDVIRRSFSQPQHRISSSQAQYRGSRSRRDPYG